jgi:hypothetical protein
MGDPPLQVIACREFRPSVGFVMMIAVQHDFEAALGDTLAEVIYERSILVQRVDGPTHAQALWHGLACSRPVERDDGERDRTMETDLTVHLLEVFG